VTTPAHPDLGARIGQVLADASPPGVASVWLFGSQAEGRAHRESDVDVAVLLRWDVHPSIRERFDERVRLSAWLGGELRRDSVDLVILNDVSPELGRRIVTAGLRVYCADAEADHAYVRDVQLRAADLDVFLRRMRALKLDALAKP